MYISSLKYSVRSIYKAKLKKYISETTESEKLSFIKHILQLLGLCIA